MSGDIKVSVSLTLDDAMSAEATKALRDLVAAADKSGKASRGAADATAKAGKAAAVAGKEGAAGANRYVRGMRDAVAQSRAVTNAARAQGAASRDAARQYEASAHAASRGAERITSGAAKAARAQKDLAEAVRRTDGTSLSRINRAMDSLAAKGRAVKANMGSFAKNAAFGVAQGVGQSIAGAARSLSLQPAVDYERRLAMMANTAFADRKTVEGRKAGMAEIRTAVNAAVKNGGGSQESAAEALDFMMAAGAVSVTDAMGMLPMIQKFASATGASSTDIAGIVTRGIQQGFFDADQAESALNMALVAGQEGGFELKDMARWLPQLMASAQGMKSIEGFQSILAAAQAAVTTAGDTDQAGNNLVNLLAKLNSKQLSDALLKNNNINLSGTLAAARENGQLPLDAFIALLNREVVGKNTQYRALQDKAGAATGAEREAILADMTDIVQASSIGEVLADRQAVMALVALLNNPAYVQQVKAAMADSAGAVDTNYALVESTHSSKQEQMALARDKAMQTTFDAVAPLLGGLVDGVTSAASAFPVVATAALAAAGALGTLAALGGVGYLLRGRAPAAAASAAVAGGAPKTRSYLRQGTAGSAPAASTPTGSAKAPAAKKLPGSVQGVASRAGIIGVAGLGLMDIASIEGDATLTRAQKNAAHAENAGGLGGAVAGGLAGAKIGALLGPIGIAIGGLIGSIGGQYIGALLGREAGVSGAPGLVAAVSGPVSGVTDTADMVGLAPEQQAIINEIRVTIDGRDVAASIEERLERMAGRGN